MTQQFGFVAYLNENVVLTLQPSEASDLAAIMWGHAEGSGHPEAGHMLNTAALMFREPRPHGRPSYFTERLESLDRPAPMTADAIRAEITRLEGELSSLSGEPLVIWDERGHYRDIPPGGATFEWSPPVGIGFCWWYPSTEQARAALLVFAREHGTVPDDDGWRVDISSPEAQFSNDAWVTRRG